MPTTIPGYHARWRHQTRLKRLENHQCLRCGGALKEGAKNITCYACRLRRAQQYHAKKNSNAP